MPIEVGLCDTFGTGHYTEVVQTDTIMGTVLSVIKLVDDMTDFPRRMHEVTRTSCDAYSGNVELSAGAGQSLVQAGSTARRNRSTSCTTD